MRRAEARRNASVMIRSSIKWSLAGNDVDWITKTSEPRTFSWISTKISMSAKRRTIAFVSGRSSQLAISFASVGLELPATSLIEPFLADIEASPRALLETTFSISQYPRKRVPITQRHPLEVPELQAANSVLELQIAKRRQNSRSASTSYFSKFVKGKCGNDIRTSESRR